MAEKKFFVDINLQGSALTNATIGTNSSLTKAGSFGFDGTRLKYFNGTAIEEVANLADVAAVTGGLIFQGGYDPTTDTPDITDGTAYKGFFWAATAAGTFLGESVQVGDSIIAKVDNAGATIADWLILQGNIVIATDSVDGISRLATQAEADAGTEGGAVVITPATLQGKIDAQITPEISNKLPLAGGTMSGDIDLDGNNIDKVQVLNVRELGSDYPVITLITPLNADGLTISDLPAPSAGGDATNKTYVDTAASTAQANAEATASADATAKADAAEAAANAYTDTGLAAKLNLAGGAMSGDLDMGGNKIQFMNGVIEGLQAPVEGLDAANKDYVDDQDALKLSLTGGTMSGSIEMSSYDILNVKEFTASTIGVDGIGTDNLTTKSGGPIRLGENLDAEDETTIINLPAPTNGGDATNKTYVDGAAATAETNANAYTDTELNASRYTGQAGVLDWTLVGGVYTQTITHNLSSAYPVVQLFDQNNKACELGVDVIDAQSILLTSNIQLGGNIYVTVLKGGAF